MNECNVNYSLRFQTCMYVCMETINKSIYMYVCMVLMVNYGIIRKQQNEQTANKQLTNQQKVYVCTDEQQIISNQQINNKGICMYE